MSRLLSSEICNCLGAVHICPEIHWSICSFASVLLVRSSWIQSWQPPWLRRPLFCFSSQLCKRCIPFALCVELHILYWFLQHLCNPLFGRLPPLAALISCSLYILNLFPAAFCCAGLSIYFGRCHNFQALALDLTPFLLLHNPLPFPPSIHKNCHPAPCSHKNCLLFWRFLLLATLGSGCSFAFMTTL